MLLGTPAYMAPEQLRGEAADAASDQFSFCVTLYEGLYGERPFAGATAKAVAASIAAEKVREPPAGSRVPPWLRRIVLRGLRAAPAQRHPSMEALLAELSRTPGRRRKRVFA